MATKKNLQGTCPVCFRSIRLAAKGAIIRHGWQVGGDRRQGEYGNSWHTGPCFGTGYPPFEVAPTGTWAYVAMLFGLSLSTLNDLQHLQTEPTLTVIVQVLTGYAKRSYGYARDRAYKHVTLTLKPQSRAQTINVDEVGCCETNRTYRYAEVLAERTAKATKQLADLAADGAALYATADGWEPAKLQAAQVKAATVHGAFERRTRKRDGSVRVIQQPRCGSTSYGLALSADASEVTCSRCLKALEKAAAEQAERDQARADVVALMAWLQGGPRQAGVRAIKAHFGWSQKRLNKACERGERDGLGLSQNYYTKLYFVRQVEAS